MQIGHAQLTTAFDSAFNDAYKTDVFSTDMNNGLIDSLRYVVDYVVGMRDANHTLHYNRCKSTS